MADEPLDSDEEFLEQVAEERRLAKKALRKSKKKQTEAKSLSWRKVDVDMAQLMLGSKESGFLGLEELDYDTWIKESKEMGLDPEKALTLEAESQDPSAENFDQQSSEVSETANGEATDGKKSEKDKKKGKQNKKAAGKYIYNII
jgi:hypothetical protein